MNEVAKPTLPRGLERRLLLLAAAGAVLLFLAVGALGLSRYLDSYWLYRGFPPPKDPAFVKQQGTTQTIHVTSPAIGGRSEQVVVYLPPDYAQSTQRYPVLYLLHGFPGDPAGFVRTVRVGVVEDTLLAKKQMKPMIIVMPMGSTGIFTDKEWANGIHKGENWETFFARDVVNAVDRQFRTSPTGAARAVGGLSEGGYASFNIGLHHPGEFRVLESWSGYERADDLGTIFGHQAQLLRANSPMQKLAAAAPALRRAHPYLWFYSGTDDKFRTQNAAFATELAAAGLPHRYYLVRGGHNWALWRGNAARALLAASRRLVGT